MPQTIATPRTLRTDIEGYFGLSYYQAVQAIVEDWRALAEIPAERLADPADTAAVTRLLHAEARLLDAERLPEWLGLFTPDCAYWIPADTAISTPWTAVSWEFNDRRRLEERVERLGTGKAYSQSPPTRSAHLYSNIEVFRGADWSGATENTLHVLCTFLIQTNFAGHPSTRAGWNGYIVRKEGPSWRIVLKRISLYDADLAQDNNSFTL
ncbi:aromatic-ring-hydroxylating dioxygenase subunit beta [Rhizobium sp. 9140]|uniref:aromatic-ring-hydroxylating dioxygenase subunit beta n=1 Tax=Rhizobium sp. 9140 TaxID=1761900 RepID=UPI000797D1FC|nr:aromatic-ring-hydroxylating dioxygenase subunit beta [Rhizobium sp. 9140]CZT37144.1 benzoate/toluate 1,2-dioxygenase beta subunit [Rhizobium sp. 9140]